MPYKKYLFFLILLPKLIIPEAPICLISIPKCGTYMAVKLLQQITKIKLHGFVPDDLIKTKNPGPLFRCHAFATPDNIAYMENKNCKCVFIYRDPRDQIVSFAHHIKKYYQHDHSIKECPEADLSLKDLITLLINNRKDCDSAIKNCPQCTSIEAKNINTIDDQYKMYLPWIKDKNTYVTTFEKLVGPKGGGNREIQIKEITNIAHHLSISLNKNQIKNLADNLFGGSWTFRKGQIGAWKEQFTEKQKSLFKEVAGELLIKLGYEKDLNW